MVAAELDEALIESVSDDLAVARARLQCPEEERLEVKSGAHATEFEVTHEQVAVREFSLPTKLIKRA
jgi:hypothetical protein